MDFQSAFAHSEHKTFKNTFLDSSHIRMSYRDGAWSDATFLERLTPYAKAAFQVDVTEFNKEKNLRFFAQGIDTEYLFCADHAEVRVGRKMYTSFAETMQPHLTHLQRFVRDVLKEASVRDISITKRNSWRIDMQDAQSDLSAPIKYILREEYADELKREGEGKGKGEGVVQKQLMLQSPLQPAGGDLFIKLGFDYTQAPQLQLTLRLQARYNPKEGVAVDEMPAIAEGLNKVIFDAYMGIVTPQVIEIMDKEGAQ